jgi:hypothetical protein
MKRRDSDFGMNDIGRDIFEFRSGFVSAKIFGRKS